MPNIRLVLEYDGRHFHGWQDQPNLRTVEGELRRVLTMVLREDINPVYGSGRTDAGVHARGQVANFRAKEIPDLTRLANSVSNILRGSLSVISAEIVPDDFHARFSATAKQYSYKIINRPSPIVLERGRAWYVKRTLDIKKMQEDAHVLIGTHDFSSFRGSGCTATSTEKEILESELIIDGPNLVYRVVGKGFLKHMVRNIVGTLVAIGRGSQKVQSMKEVLGARDRRRAGITAPPYGLYLDWVKY